MEPGVQKVITAYAIRMSILMLLLIATIVMMVLVADGHYDWWLWSAGLGGCFVAFSIYFALWVSRTHRPALKRLREEHDERIRREMT